MSVGIEELMEMFVMREARRMLESVEMRCRGGEQVESDKSDRERFKCCMESRRAEWLYEKSAVLYAEWRQHLREQMLNQGGRQSATGSETEVEVEVEVEVKVVKEVGGGGVATNESGGHKKKSQRKRKKRGQQKAAAPGTPGTESGTGPGTGTGTGTGTAATTATERRERRTEGKAEEKTKKKEAEEQEGELGRLETLKAVCVEIYTCPITLRLMREPVMLADGHSYERAAIETWLARSNVSPITNLPLQHTMYTSNHALRAAIEALTSSFPSCCCSPRSRVPG